MNYPAKLIPTLAAALLLCCPAIFAQNPEEETSGPTVEALFEKAPQLEAQSPRLYRIRNVNIHGVQFINPEMIRYSSGLIPGDTIYLPSHFI